MATVRFSGFGHDAIAWFEGLEQDNSRDYFHRTRAQWEASVRGPLEELLAELSGRFGGSPRLFRPHRDVRFSRDKSPYKTATAGVLTGRPENASALYAEISADGVFAGAGYYQMARDQLQRFRDAVADERSGQALERIVAEIEGSGLRIGGEALKTAPRGFSRDHPRIRLLRHKGLTAGLDLPPGRELTGRGALDHVARVWGDAGPLNDWLDRRVGPSRLPPDERGGRPR